MPTKIYVGNLPWRATDAQLSQLFGAHGDVSEAKIVTDRETGRSRGFGFVTMTDDGAAQTAIRAMNGYSLEGRNLVVNEARDQGGGGGGFRRGGGGGGGAAPATVAAWWRLRRWRWLRRWRSRRLRRPRLNSRKHAFPRTPDGAGHARSLPACVSTCWGSSARRPRGPPTRCSGRVLDVHVLQCTQFCALICSRSAPVARPSRIRTRPPGSSAARARRTSRG